MIQSKKDKKLEIEGEFDAHLLRLLIEARNCGGENTSHYISCRNALISEKERIIKGINKEIQK